MVVKCNFTILYRDQTIARKELDLEKLGKRFILEREQKSYLMETIKKDCLFFEKNGIIDYSLLVGVHKIEGGEPPRQNLLVDPNAKSSSSFVLTVSR